MCQRQTWLHILYHWPHTKVHHKSGVQAFRGIGYSHPHKRGQLTYMDSLVGSQSSGRLVTVCLTQMSQMSCVSQTQMCGVSATWI